MGWKKTLLNAGIVALDIGLKEYKRSKKKPRKTTRKNNKKKGRK